MRRQKLCKEVFEGVHSNGAFVPVGTITLLKHMIAGAYSACQIRKCWSPSTGFLLLKLQLSMFRVTKYIGFWKEILLICKTQGKIFQNFPSDLEELIFAFLQITGSCAARTCSKAAPQIRKCSPNCAHLYLVSSQQRAKRGGSRGDPGFGVTGVALQECNWGQDPALHRLQLMPSSHLLHSAKINSNL